MLRLGLALLTLILLAGCGTGTAGTDTGADEAAGRVGTWEAPVAGVRALPGDGGLAITVTLPAGEPDCVVDARADHVGDDAGVLHVTTTFDGVSRSCPDSQERTVELAVPPRGRDVALNSELWKPRRDGRYVRCSPELGCHPPADRCADVWTRLLTDGKELPPEQRVDVLACADGWLVADVDAVVTGCQSVDGSTPPPGCAGSGVHTRWFARLDDRRWQVVASGTTAGCTPVADVPDFPRRLCGDLPAR